MKLFNNHSIEWKLAVLLTVRLASMTLVHGQETADRVFLWDKGDSGHGFWNKAINCGKASQPGGANNTKGSRVKFGVTRHQRFPGTHSVELWTNSNYEERCNQNFTAERAEISSYNSYRSLGVREGATVWMGWSEIWTDIDESHTATVLQFRSNCGSGSPAVEMYMNPGRKLTLRTRQNPKYVREFLQVKKNVWYDVVVEIKYSKRNDGYIKFWIHEAGAPGGLNYNNPSAQILNNPTMLSGDNCPHIRWGVYRWQSGDKRPGQIPAKDRLMAKYTGPTRIKVGNNLRQAGFNAVVPRSPDGRKLDTTPPPVVEEKKEEEQPTTPEEETYVESETGPVGPCEQGENLALDKVTRQSSKYGYGDPGRAVDADLSTSRGPWTNGSITHTQKEKEAWWEVDLGDTYTLSEVRYTGRTDCCRDRLKNTYVMVSEKPFSSNRLNESLNQSGVWNSFQADFPNPTHKVSTGEISGRYVRIQLKGTDFLSLADVKVMGCPVVVSAPSENTQGKFFEDSQIAPDADTTEELRFSPNVASKFVNIEIKRPAVILITDFNGVKVKEMKLTEGTHKVWISHIPNGVYLITRYYGDSRSHGKLIIQR